jgi:hypothetical protein
LETITQPVTSQPAHQYLAGSVLGGLDGKLPPIWGINGKKEQKV